MIKILYNPSTTVTVSLKDVGVKIKPQEEHTIPMYRTSDYAASSEILDAIRDGDIQVGNGDIYYTDAGEGEVYLRTLSGDSAFIKSDSGGVNEFDNIVVTDSSTGKKACVVPMNQWTMMRELYNDPSNPVYLDSGFTPILGEGGWAEDHADRILNLENIHAKHGWHQNEIRGLTYKKPKDLLIYYGWLNSFNSAQNSWDNEKVAQDMAKYDIIVFGDGVQDTGHGDYANTSVIIPRLKELKPSILIFGYVTVNQSLANFQNKVDDWDDLEVDGIMMDEAGYDFGTTTTNDRDAFNTKVDYVHDKTYSNICFVNAWNMDHIIGTDNDGSYPNATWNPSTNESNLTNTDWYLLESFAVNTAAYTSPADYAPKADWIARGTKAISHRYTYGINLASVNVIEDGLTADEDFFDFTFISACMWGLEANGSSDIYYGASSAKTEFLPRPDVSGLQNIWSLSPSVQEDNNDSDVYHRYVDFGKLSLDFSTGAEVSTITKY